MLPDGSVVLDETVGLTRGAALDSANRGFTVRGDSIVVAFADERLTDVKLKLSAAGGARDFIAPVAVENKLGGAGLEIATLQVRDGARVTVALEGMPTADKPGAVHLRVKLFSPKAARATQFAAQVAGFEAWSAATNATYRGDDFKEKGLEQIDRAIASLESPHGDPPLAAQARLVKANLLASFEVDFRATRAEAQHAANSFAAVDSADALHVARARYVEALGLRGISLDRAAVDPTADEATQLARGILADLAGAHSPFGPVERARALDVIGSVDLNASKLDAAKLRFEEARALYHAAGNPAGEFEMQANLAQVLAERGRRTEASEAYEAVLPGIDRIPNPAKRVTVLVAAAGAQSFSGRTDEAAENLLKALAIARDNELPLQEAAALQTLGYLYAFRGDYLQAKALLARALEITRAQKDVMELVYALQAAGVVARFDGDFAAAIEMHREGVERSSNPIVRTRTMRHLGLDYLAVGKPAEAIAQFRAGLAVDLGDQDHYAYSDVRRDLAEALIAQGDGSRAILKEAAALVATALRQSRDVQDPLGEIGAHRVLAALNKKQGHLVAAREEFERTFGLIFKYRGTTANPQFRFAALDHEVAAFRGYFDLVMREVAARGPARIAPASATELGALRVLERAREVHFGAVRAAPMDAAAVARVDALLAQMADKSLKIARLLKRDPTAPESTQLAQLQLDMANLRSQVDRERTAGAGTLVADPAASNAERTWRAIKPGSIQISYALGDEHAYVWTRGALGTQAAMLSETPEQMERELTELAALDRQASPAAVEQALAHISSVLLPAGLLPANTNAVEIVAEGRIASVPFAGLRSPLDGTRHLAETHAITMVTSLFDVPEAPRPGVARPFRLVALASGSGVLRSAAIVDPAPRLHAAMSEIRAVADQFERMQPAAKVKLLAGGEGNAAALSAIWSSGADVVHFATHALANLRQPLASLLVLPATDASGAPTYLTAGQVLGWRGDADLVFLSACDSAIGPPRFAAGMPGLQGAFLHAGARGVIATLWPIEDVLARSFSEDFYRRYTTGISAAQALGETQRAWLAPQPGLGAADQIRRRITALAHAYFAK